MSESISLPFPGSYSIKIYFVEGIKKPVIFSFILAAFVTILLFVSINSLQGLTLSEILSIPSADLGNLTGSLTFYDEISALVTVLFWGLFSDIVGRFLIFSMGFFLMSLGLGLFCYAKTYFPELVVYRVIFGSGGSASSAMLSACLADFCTDQDRGKFAALIGFVSGLGAIIAVTTLLPLPIKIGLKATFLVNAFIALVVAILMIVITFIYRVDKFIPSPIESRSSLDSVVGPDTPLLPSVEHQQSFSNSTSNILIKVKNVLHAGLSASRQDGLIILGYFASFLARSDSLAVNLFLPIWIFRHFVSKGECTDSGDLIKNSCHSAYVSSSILSGITQLFSLVGAPFFGYLLDKYDRKLIVLASSFLASLGYILISQTPDPSSMINILYLGLVGLGEIGLIISSVALVTHSGIPQDARGFISGISSFSGALGVLVTSKVGGILFDISSGWPFLFLGLVHLSFVMLTFIYFMMEK